MSLKDVLLAAIEPTVETVSIPGIADPVKIKIMDGYARDGFQKILQDEGISDSAYFGALIVACVMGEDGNPLFGADEVGALRKGNAELVRKIGLECQRVNGMGKTAVEDEEKNSEAIQSSSSGTD